jgi:urease accessory protein
LLATARVHVEADGSGTTRLAVLRSEPPLLLRPTGPDTVHLVGGAAGPLGGDRLRFEVDVGPGASLTVRTAAASLALPGPDGAPSRLEISASVAAGGRLSWLPEPLIAAAGCRHTAQATINVAAGASLLWRDELRCGRHGEQPGDVRLLTRLRVEDSGIYRHELAVGPDAPGWSGPAVLGEALALGSLLTVHPTWLETGPPPARVLGPAAAAMPLAGPAVLVTAVGADTRSVRQILDAAICGMPLPGPDPHKINQSPEGQ